MSRTDYQLNQNKYLSKQELNMLNHRLRRYYDENPKCALALLIAINTGARATEVLNLKLEDISNGFIQITGIKGSRSRQIPISPDIDNKIQQYIRRAQILIGEKLFDFSYQWLYRSWLFYRPVDKKIHSLRHTFAIELYRKTKDVRLVMYALGHRSIRNTQIYVDYDYSQHELKKSMGIS